MVLALISGLGLVAAVMLRATFDANHGGALVEGARPLRQAVVRASAALEDAALRPEDAESAGVRADFWRHEEQATPAPPHLRARAESANAPSLLDQIERAPTELRHRAGELGPARPATDPATVASGSAGRPIIELPLAAIDPTDAAAAQRFGDGTGELQHSPVVAFALAAGLLTAAGVAGWLTELGHARRLRGRLRELTRQASEIGATDRPTPLPPHGDDEVGSLAAAISRLASTLAEQHARLEAITALLATVNEAATTLTSTLQLDELGGVVLDQLTRVVAVEKAAIFLHDGDGPGCLASRNWTAADDAAFRALIASAASPLMRCFLAPPPSRGSGSGALASADRTVVAQPLTVRDQHVGTLALVSPRHAPFSDDDCRAIALIGAHVAVALENARLFAARKQAGIIEERARLAREIHDTLAQGLAAIVLHLETADTLLDGSASDQGRQHLRRACDLARANLEEARRSVRDLRAAPLASLDLPRALERLAQTTTEATGIRVRCEIEHPSGRLPAPVEAGLYRIAQEALANAVRHAAPTAVTIRLVADGASVRLSIADDGHGFDPNTAGDATEGKGFGILGMRERAALLGGSLEIQSRPLSGTQVIVTVPSGLDQPAEPLAPRSG